MDDAPNRNRRNVQSTSFWLLASLLVSLLVVPLLETLSLGRTLLLLGLTITFILGTAAARSKLTYATLTLVVVALPTAWATLFVDSKAVFFAHCVLGSAFFWLVGGMLVYVAITSHRITFDSIFSVSSAYLLFGLAWALSYWAIHAVAPSTFVFPNEGTTALPDNLRSAGDFSQFVYYTFVTMSTLGFGDMTPANRITRRLSWLQSVTGQFFVAVIVAWLVSALPRPGRESE